MKARKKLLALLLATFMMLPFFAVTMSATDNPSLSIDKTTYEVGESIMVTATGTPADWDWIALVPQGGSYVYYYYITDANNGQAVDLTALYKAYYGTDIPAGSWYVAYVPDYGANETYATITKDFTVVAPSPVVDPNASVSKPSSNFTFTLDDAASGWAKGSGTVSIDSQAAVLYWGDFFGKLADHDPIGYYKAVDGKATIEIPAGIPIPAKANCLMAYGYDNGVETETYQRVFLPATANSVISSNKMVYEVGEPIYITASTTSAARLDWVGVSPAGATYSSAYYYIGADTNEVPVDVTLQELPMILNGSTSWMEFAPGKYDISWVPKNYGLSSRTVYFTIEVVEEKATEPILDPPAAPTAVTYELEKDTDGMADGVLNITLPERHQAKDIVMYWADDNGPLAGYTALAKFKVALSDTKIVHNMTANTLIPEGATKLLVYTSNELGLSAEPFAVTLPEDSANKGFGALLDEFQIVSDIHITSNTNLQHYNTNFQKMLEDIVANSPNSSGIYINGDLANAGTAEEYQMMWDLYNAVEGAPHLYLGIGNHDLYTGFEDGIQLFLDNATLADGTHPEKAYYDVWTNGYHFIFLAPEETMSGQGIVLTEEQLAWLREKLEEDRDPSKPVFVMIHCPMYDTVAGSLEGEGWHGVENARFLREVLQDFPETVLLSGHTHWHLNSEATMVERSDKLPTMFNTASVAYLWDGYDVKTGVNLDGSQGYYVRVYADKLLVLGRDFSTGEWISSAQFVVDYAGLGEEDDDHLNDVPPEGGNTDDGNIGDTDTDNASTGDVGMDNIVTGDVNTGNANDSVSTDDGTTAPTGDDRAGGSSLAAILGCVIGGIAIIGIASAVAVMIKKKK